MKNLNIKKLLHHRDPYLLLDEVVDITETSIITSYNLKADTFFFKGHFPSAPVLPGALMQEMTTQSAGILITQFHSPVENYDSEKTKGHALGVLKKVNYAKFKGFAKPTDQLEIKVELTHKVENLFEFTGRIYNKGKVIMSNSFQLINTSDELLLQ